MSHFPNSYASHLRAPTVAPPSRPTSVHFGTADPWGNTVHPSFHQPLETPLYPHGYAPPSQIPPQRYVAPSYIPSSPPPRPSNGHYAMPPPPPMGGSHFAFSEPLQPVFSPPQAVPEAMHTHYNGGYSSFALPPRPTPVINPPWPANSEYGHRRPWDPPAQFGAEDLHASMAFTNGGYGEPLTRPARPARSVRAQSLFEPDAVMTEETSASPKQTKRRRKGLMGWVKKLANKTGPNEQAPESSGHVPDLVLEGSHMNGKERRDSTVDPRYAPITPEEWRTFSWFASPVIADVRVDNLSPRPDLYPAMQQVRSAQELVGRLRGPNRSPHPENWIPGFRLSTIPPRPVAFPPPDPGARGRPSQETTLNPFLEHRLCGMSPLQWDVRTEVKFNVAFTTESTHPPNNVILMQEGDLYQPATYPLRTSMRITGIADDRKADLWPVEIYNAQGVLCGDVLHTIYTNFNQRMTREEWNSLPAERQRRVSLAWQTRIASPPKQRLDPEGTEPQEVPRGSDPLRRVDYLLDRIQFRGLAPRDDGTWVVCLGPP